MDVRLEGKVLLITGSTQGLGARIAAMAIASGVAAVMLSGRNEDKGLAVAKELAGQGAQVAFQAADLALPNAPTALAAHTIATFGRIDLLVNCAGLTDRASILDGGIALWDRLFAVNARAPFFLMQAAIADMMGRDAPGAIVNIQSINAHCGAPDLSIYSASKGALATLTRNVANACLARNIRVNGINMGWVPTAAEHRMQGETLGQGACWQERAAASMPLKRLLTEEEVASVAIFLLSDTAGLMTGALLDVEQTVLGAPADAKRL